jgi:hypothetical protein
MLRVVLRKPWRSRMRVYPIGTVFIRGRMHMHDDGAWYNYDAPGVGTGMVYFANSVHNVITEEQALLVALRRRDREEHLLKMTEAGHIFLSEDH